MAQDGRVEGRRDLPAAPGGFTCGRHGIQPSNPLFECFIVVTWKLKAGHSFFCATGETEAQTGVITGTPRSTLSLPAVTGTDLLAQDDLTTPQGYTWAPYQHLLSVHKHLLATLLCWTGTGIPPTPAAAPKPQARAGHHIRREGSAAMPGCAQTQTIDGQDPPGLCFACYGFPPVFG